MRCLREVASHIVAQSADYVITLKKNQASLYERVEATFKQAQKKIGRAAPTQTIRLNKKGMGHKKPDTIAAERALVEPLNLLGKCSNLNGRWYG